MIFLMYYNFRIKPENKTKHSFPLCFLLCPNIPKTSAMMNVIAEVRMKVGRPWRWQRRRRWYMGMVQLDEDVKVGDEWVKSSIKVRARYEPTLSPQQNGRAGEKIQHTLH